MSTNFHTPIATGAAANAATVNAPLGTLDAAINTLNNAKVSKLYESDGGGPAVQVTAGGNVMVNTSTDITGATLQVAGGVVVSDGAGAALLTETVDYTARRANGATGATLTAPSGSGTVYSQTAYSSAITAGSTWSICTISPAVGVGVAAVKLFGFAFTTAGKQIFEVVMARSLGGSNVISFTSHGAVSGSAFLASEDFTVTEIGGTAITMNYVNNETTIVGMCMDVITVCR